LDLNNLPAYIEGVDNNQKMDFYDSSSNDEVEERKEREFGAFSQKLISSPRCHTKKTNKKKGYY
jgi:hypothetical protein